MVLISNMAKVFLKFSSKNTQYDRLRVDIYSAHVLISITFAVFEYLDTALTTENKILRFSRAVLTYETICSNVNLTLILYFRGQTSYKRGT